MQGVRSRSRRRGKGKGSFYKGYMIYFNYSSNLYEVYTPSNEFLGNFETLKAVKDRIDLGPDMTAGAIPLRGASEGFYAPGAPMRRGGLPRSAGYGRDFWW